MRMFLYSARLCACLTVLLLACGQARAQVQAYLDYDPVLGTLSVESASPTNGIVTFELVSNEQFLTTTYPLVLDGLFDVYTPGKIFKLDTDGFFDIDFGPILTTELPAGELASNLCLSGSMLQGGALENVHVRSGGATFPLSSDCNFDPNFNPNANAGNPTRPPRPNPDPDPTPDPLPDPGPIVVGQGGLPFYLDFTPATGGLVINSPDAALTTLELDSQAELFTGQRPASLNGLFDVLLPRKLFHLRPEGFNSLDVGNVVTPGTSAETLASDICYQGSVLSGGRPGDLFVRSSDQLHQVSCGIGVGNPNPNPDPNPEPNPNPVMPATAQPFFLDFDSATGALAIDSPESAITVLELVSNSGIFVGPKPSSLDSIFDVFVAGKAFRLDIEGFHSLDLENAVAAGTSAEVLAADICYSGAVLQGGPLAEMYVRSGDVVHAVTCGAPNDSVDLAAAMDPDADIGVFVDPDGGHLVVHVPGEPDGAFRPLTRFEISADSEVFLPGNKLAGTLDGAADVLTESRLLKIDENGFGTVDFGPILRDGVSLTDLESVFSVSATFDGGEVASAVQFVNLAIVPEPSNGFFLISPALLLLARRRRW